MSCNRMNTVNAAAEAVQSVRHSHDRERRTNDMIRDVSCRGNVIRPVGLTCRDGHCSGRKKVDVRNGYAYCSSFGTLLSRDVFSLQSITVNGGGITVYGDGRTVLEKGTYFISYKASGAASERNGAFTVIPYADDKEMRPESASFTAANVGDRVSVSNSFILRTEGCVLYFKAEGTQMLTSASFCLCMIRL